MRVGPWPFYPPEDMAQSVREKVRQARKRGEPVDFLTLETTYSAHHPKVWKNGVG
jgi:hypothetical protein